MIEFRCLCGFAKQVKDEFAGKKGKCPKCGAVVTVPELKTESGQAPEETFEAPETEMAEEAVGETEAAGEETLEQFDAGEPLSASAPAAAVATAYKQPQAKVNAPNYGAVRLMGTIYMVLGCITCGIGVIVLLLAVSAAAHGGIGVAVAGMGLWAGGMLFLAGLVLVGFGQLFYCMRDMAQNSFHLTRI